MTQVTWERADYSRVPYRLFHDPQIYELEQKRIFRGPVWSYLCLEAEIPKAGDFRTTWLGDTPVLVTRGMAGEIFACENRCAHRGALVRREAGGNDTSHTCIYHRWNYHLNGDLRGVPFQRGIRNEGGLAEDFDKQCHGLAKLKVATYKGVVFGSFSEPAEALEGYLGGLITGHLDGIMQKPIEILGYQRQRILGNWKMYNENLRDTYHASLLHEFLVTFGLDRATQRGGVEMDGRHRHNITYTYMGTDDDAQAKQAYSQQNIRSNSLSLADASMLRYQKEFGDGRSMATSSVFPNVAFARFNNTMATRQIQPRGPDAFVLVWTCFGYADDSEDLRRHRLNQMNLLGPGGYVSMEDSEAIEIVHRASRAVKERSAVVEVGGRGAIVDCPFRVTDVPVRGFWSYYAEVMGIEPKGGVR